MNNGAVPDQIWQQHSIIVEMVIKYKEKVQVIIILTVVEIIEIEIMLTLIIPINYFN